MILNLLNRLLSNLSYTGSSLELGTFSFIKDRPSKIIKTAKTVQNGPKKRIEKPLKVWRTIAQTNLKNYNKDCLL